MNFTHASFTKQEQNYGAKQTAGSRIGAADQSPLWMTPTTKYSSKQLNTDFAYGINCKLHSIRMLEKLYEIKPTKTDMVSFLNTKNKKLMAVHL